MRSPICSGDANWSSKRLKPRRAQAEIEAALPTASHSGGCGRRLGGFETIGRTASDEIEALVGRAPYVGTHLPGWHAILGEHQQLELSEVAVWISRTDRLRDLGRARNQAVVGLATENGAGVAHHQVDVFLLAAGEGRYMGRLCTFATCPKGQAACRVPGCGATAFLRQHEAFVLAADALAPGRAATLFDRRSGVRVKASRLTQGCA